MGGAVQLEAPLERWSPERNSSGQGRGQASPHSLRGEEASQEKPKLNGGKLQRHPRKYSPRSPGSSPGAHLPGQGGVKWISGQR